MNEWQAHDRLVRLQAYAALTQIVQNFRSDSVHWAYGLATQSTDYGSEYIAALQLKIVAELKELSDGLWP
jgi:hypothetical protein